jgi:hypothetical protein
VEVAGASVVFPVHTEPVEGDELLLSQKPTHSYEATREAAMAAYAKSWRRE